MSCSPGMQTIPQDEEYRFAFNSPDGFTLIVLDASQVEARISADTTGDQPAIEVFQKGGDIYKEDGEAFYNTTIDKNTPEGKKLRNRAKAAWLGLSYGQGKRKFHTYSKLFLGEDLDKSDTDLLYNKFFEVHWKMKEVMDEWSSYVDPTNSGRYIFDHVVPLWIDDERAKEYLLPALIERTWGDETLARKQLKTLLANKNKVRYAETILGRKRFFRADFLGWWTAGRNMPIQGTAADIQKATMLAFQNMHWEQKFDAHIINVVHDEIITLVREDQAEDLFHRQVKLGESVGQKFLQHVPMKVDGGITKQWKKF
jgi:DNA polymerase-1